MAQNMSSGGGRFRAFDSYEPDYRKHFQSSFHGTNMNYDEYRPAYRYGYDLATGDRYRGRNWSEIEPEVRRDWEQRNPSSTWDKVKGAVRQAWDSISNP